MASFTVDDDGWDGDTHRRVLATATMSNSYTAGGEALTPGDVGLESIDSVTVLHGVTAGGYVPRYDPAADAILLYEASGSAGALAEVAGATDVSSETVKLEIRGRS